MHYLVVFLVMTLTDFVWAQYMSSVARQNTISASIWSVGVILLGSYVTRAYVADYGTIIPACLGAFAGTYASVKLKYWWNAP